MQPMSTTNNGAAVALLLVIGIPIFAAWLVSIIGLWKVYVKAGHAGWKSIIPILNTVILCRIAQRPGWWFLLLCIPFVNVIFAFIVFIDLAHSFGKGTGFGVLAVFFPYVAFPILGFGSATYRPVQRFTHLPPPPAA